MHLADFLRYGTSTLLCTYSKESWVKEEIPVQERLMKAIVATQYGSPDVIRFEEITKPAPADNEVLVKICAASVNPLDWHFMRGEPLFIRLMLGLRKPKVIRLGVDVAGVVETVGRNVTQFKPGDAVFGGCRGAFAEYVC